jgi:hypothetical protein
MKKMVTAAIKMIGSKLVRILSQHGPLSGAATTVIATPFALRALTRSGSFAR